MLLAPLWQRVATAAVVPPTVTGVMAVTQGLAGMGACTTLAIIGGNYTEKFIRVPSTISDANLAALPQTLARTLIVPSLVEEVLWRVILQPPGMPLPYMILVNLAFAGYHVVGSATLAERLEGRQGARAVFSDPTFLMLAFLLGNACSYTYVKAGYALWAPVVTHAIPVTLWLTSVGGDAALSTPGGLSSSSR